MILLEKKAAHGVFRLSRNSLIEEEVQAIVNPANEHLSHGGGVAGLISKAGGPAIQEESNRKAPIPTGRATYTTAGRLPYRYIIHAVGPVYHDGRRGEPEKLASAVRSALKTAASLNLESIALPAISTGIFGYPLRPAVEIIVETVLDFLSSPSSLMEIRLVEYSPDKAEEIRVIIDSMSRSTAAF